MISSGNDEEVPDKGEFIRNLKDYLSKNTNNYLSCFDLFSYIKKNADLSSPQLNTIRDIGDSGGDFIFQRNKYSSF